MAVPISTMMSGGSYSSSAATAATMRSAPTWLGLSMRILSPVLMPGPTTIGLQPATLMTAERMAL